MIETLKNIERLLVEIEGRIFFSVVEMNEDYNRLVKKYPDCYRISFFIKDSQNNNSIVILKLENWGNYYGRYYTKVF
jgi:hypothetical protein